MTQPDTEKDRYPPDAGHADPVDDASDDSFPASDPPSSTGSAAVG